MFYFTFRLFSVSAFFVPHSAIRIHLERVIRGLYTPFTVLHHYTSFSCFFFFFAFVCVSRYAVIYAIFEQTSLARQKNLWLNLYNMQKSRIEERMKTQQKNRYLLFYNVSRSTYLFEA